MGPFARFSPRSILLTLQRLIAGESRLDMLSRLLALAWTALIVVLLSWSFVATSQVTRDLALNEAHAILKKDQSFRLWAVSYGGLYVVNHGQDSTPYPIDGLPQNITLQDGMKLTLLFPGQIQREIDVEFTGQYGISGRLTSLDPLNPQNVPDEWEQATLQAFQDGEPEVAEFTRIEGAPYLRLAEPLTARPSCLTCHTNATAGDILGAENIALPMENYLGHQQKTQTMSLASYSLLWLLGLVGIGVGYRELKKDSQERVRSENALRESEARYRDLLENANDLVQSVGANGRFQYVNRRWIEMMGYSFEEAVQLYFWEILRSDQVSHCMQVFKKLQKTPVPQRIETIFVTKDGKEVVVEGNINAQSANGSLQATRGIFRDVTERKYYEANLEFLATHDSLTGLPNRVLVLDILSQALERARSAGESLAVMFLDLDGFKIVNDQCGHKEGDELLRLLSERLKSSLRSSDTVARFGGDEFLILVESLRTPADAARVAEKLLGGLARPFDLAGRPVSLTGSLGISMFPQDGGEIGALIKKADTAMYAVKDRGRSNYLFYASLASPQ